MSYINKLWKSYLASPNIKDRKKLVLHYLGLVKYVAARLAAGLPDSVEMDDLVGAGMMGLMKAVEAFDASKDVKFETYALSRIRGAMLDELRSLDWFPRSIRRKARRISQATEELEGSLGRSPTDGEMARHMDLDLHDFYRMAGEVSKSTLLSIEEEIRTRLDGTYTTIQDMLPDMKIPPADDLLETKETKGILRELLVGMPERERLVLTLYYYEELTLAEIGEVLGVTESRVCQIHGKSIQRLKTRLRERVRDPHRVGLNVRRGGQKVLSP